MGMAKFTMSIPEAMRKAGGRDEAPTPRHYPGDDKHSFRVFLVERKLRSC